MEKERTGRRSGPIIDRFHNLSIRPSPACSQWLRGEHLGTRLQRATRGTPAVFETMSGDPRVSTAFGSTIRGVYGLEWSKGFRRSGQRGDRGLSLVEWGRRNDHGTSGDPSWRIPRRRTASTRYERYRTCSPDDAARPRHGVVIERPVTTASVLCAKRMP